MMKRLTATKKILCSSLITAIILTQTTQATETKSSQSTAPVFSIDLEAGINHDSQLKIEEIDRNEATSDNAKLVKLKLKSEWQPVKPLSIKASYTLNQKRFQNNSDFDQSMQLINLDGSYAFSWLTLGSSYNTADVDVAKESFLTLKQHNYYVAKLINKTVYLRATKRSQEKTFDVYDDRNEDNDALTGDMFIFFNNARSVLSFSYTDEEAITDSSEFSYQGNSFQARYSNQFKLFDKDSKWQLGWQKQDKDYLEVSPTLESNRQDRKETRDLQLEMRLIPQLTAIGKIQHAQYRSNLAEAEYNATEISLSFKFSY